MRAYLYTIIFICCLCTSAHAQTAANYYNIGKSLSDQAKEMLTRMAVFDKATNDKIIGLFKSSAENYLKAREMMPGLQNHAAYNAAINLYDAAVQCRAGNDDSKAYEYIKQAVDLWPTLSSL